MAESKDMHIFLTGYPAFTARMVLEGMLRKGFRVTFLVQEKFQDQARDFIKKHGKLPGRADYLVGDVVALDLGLSGKEIKSLVQTVTHFHHMASIFHLGVPADVTRSVNVRGTRHALALAKEMKRLERFMFYSTAFVSGDRTGVILEEDLDYGQGFRNAYESTKFTAEKVVRNTMGQLPISVLRPSMVVGHSQTGEIDRLDGPYYIINLIVNMPVDIPLPLPGKGVYPLNMIPVDFLTDAAIHIARDPDAAGKTFHIVDPNPLPARKVFELVARSSGRSKPKGTVPPVVSKLLFKVPGLQGPLRPWRVLFDFFDKLVLFNSTNTLKSLSGTSIFCPPFNDYVDNLVRYIKLRQKKSSTKKHNGAERLFYPEDPYY